MHKLRRASSHIPKHSSAMVAPTGVARRLLTYLLNTPRRLSGDRQGHPDRDGHRIYGTRQLCCQPDRKSHFCEPVVSSPLAPWLRATRPLLALLVPTIEHTISDDSEVVQVACIKALEGVIRAGVAADHQTHIVQAIQNFLSAKDLTGRRGRR